MNLEVYFECIDSFDRNDSESLDRIIEYLKENAPYIKWITSWHDDKFGSYLTLNVPVEQKEDANNIYEMYTSGEDIREYVLVSKYPGIYVFKDNQWVLENKIEDYIYSFQYIKCLLGSPTNKPEILLQTLVELLPELYIKTWELPNEEYYFDHSLVTILSQDLEIFTEEQIIEFYLAYHVDLLMISILVNEILKDVLNYSYFSGGSEKVSEAEVAGMVYEWQYTFLESGGWGEKLLKLIMLIHQSIQKIELSLKPKLII